MSSYPSSPNYVDWLRGWKEWARTRKRGRMAQFIIEKLEEGKQAKWISISSGLFELTEWHLIAKEWFGEKPRNSEEVDAPCMLRKGLPRAFPGLDEVKERSRKEGTQYKSRVFQAPATLLQEVLLHVTNNGPHSVVYTSHLQETSNNDQSYIHTTTGGQHTNAYHYSNDGSGFTIPTSNYYPMIQVKSEFGTQVTNNLTHTMDHINSTASATNATDFSRLLTNGGERYLHHHHQSQTFRNSELERMADVIAGGGHLGNGGTNDMDTITSTSANNYHTVPPPSTTPGLVNGWSPYTVSTEATVGSLLPNSPPVYIDDINAVGGVSVGGGASTTYSMNSPSGGTHTYHHSPVSAHSPRISPEPSHLSTSSYPSSVSDLQMPHPPLSAGLVSGVKTHQSVINGVIDVSPSNVQSPNVVQEELPDIMEVKALPNSSPTEGGGHMALVFYQPLPMGPKVVYFISTSSHGYYQIEQAYDENPHTLSCPIPKYPIAEEVELRVFCDSQPIASTSFTFYQQLPSSPEMLLQMLNSQLHSQFQIGGGSGGAIGGATGGGATGQTTYSGYIPTSMYQLLLGACRLGCEPLVFCLLCSPIMDKISGDQLKEAYQCASENGHENLSDHLMEIHLLHDMSNPGLLSRGEGQTMPSHVPAYYDAIDQLDQGGDTPQERAEAVYKFVLDAVQKKGDDEKEEKEEKEEKVIDDTTPTVETFASLSLTVSPGEDEEKETVNDLTPVETGLKRRLSSSSKLIRQTNSISDEMDHSRDIPPTTSSDSLKPFSPSRRESADIIADLPPPTNNNNIRKLPINQISDADSAIGMSFDEDGISQIDGSRRSSLLTDEGTGQMGVKVALSRQNGIEVANDLEWETVTTVIVTNDYPLNQEKKMFYKGDQIVQIGDYPVRNLDSKSFGKLFQSELSSGTVVSIIPSSPTDRSILGRSDSKLLLRTPSEQSLFLPPRVNQLLNMKPSNQERKVSIPYTSSGFGFKIVGGKTFGLFMTDIRPDLSSMISNGDQILEINGCITQGLTLYDANKLVGQQQSKGLNLNLTVLENKAKFSMIRDQFELDSFYVRSLIDYTPSNTRDMPLKKGSLLRVVNTSCSPHFWLAWSVDENSGIETQLQRIPNGGQKQYGRPVYERLSRAEGKLRPVLIVGPSSQTLASSMCDIGEQFKMCASVEDVLKTSAKGAAHGVMSVNDVNTVQNLSDVHPIVIQVTRPDKTTIKDYMSFDKLNIDASLVSDKGTSELTKQGLAHIHKIQSRPLFEPMGPLLVN